MTDLNAYLRRLDELSLASSLANLQHLRSTLDKLSQPESFDIDVIEKEIIGLSPELYTFIFRQAALEESAAPISQQMDAAISKLGFRRVKKLIFFHIAYSEDLKRFSNALDREFAAQLWSYNYRVASLAESLASRILPDYVEEIFYLGMLQKIGLSALAFLEPSKHRSLRESKRPVPLAEKEKEHLGVSHYELGTALAQSWNLPATHAASIRFEATQGRSVLDVADSKLGDLFTLLYFAKYRAESRKQRENAVGERRPGIDPYFAYDKQLLQKAAEWIREAA